MEKLICEVSALKSGPVSRTVKKRMEAFSDLGRGPENGVFKELCFCILTANYSAEGGMRVQDAIGDGFISMPEKRLAITLKQLGYRFPNARAGYIVRAREMKGRIMDAIATQSGPELRNWLARNVYGLGFKEASHFLRNIGRPDFAIIDFHIIDLLARRGMIEKPGSKSLSKKRYEDIESRLGTLAAKAGLSQGELDLYLWYMETGKVLK